MTGNLIAQTAADPAPIMSMTTVLLSGLSVVTSALAAAVGKLWQSSVECARDRIELRKLLEEYIAAHAHNEGRLEFYQACPENKCPFKDAPITTKAVSTQRTLSLHPKT